MNAKTLFRKTVGKAPMGVRRKITEYKVKDIMRHVLPREIAIKCESDDSFKAKVLQNQMKKYPKSTKSMEKKINELFSTNSRYKMLGSYEKGETIQDMQFCWFGYGFQIDEYVFFDLGHTNKDPEKRRAFVSDSERLAFRFCANDFTNDIYADKASAYDALKPYYKRMAIVVEGEKDRGRFESFIAKNSRFVQKSVNSSRGQGVKLIDLEKYAGGVLRTLMI